jgi:hypothetical protein
MLTLGKVLECIPPFSEVAAVRKATAGFDTKKRLASEPSEVDP